MYVTAKKLKWVGKDDYVNRKLTHSKHIIQENYWKLKWNHLVIENIVSPRGFNRISQIPSNLFANGKNIYLEKELTVGIVQCINS